MHEIRRLGHRLRTRAVSGVDPGFDEDALFLTLRATPRSSKFIPDRFITASAIYSSLLPPFFQRRLIDLFERVSLRFGSKLLRKKQILLKYIQTENLT
ncbi:MAG: hypothetical protein VX929_07670, partial [Pseudomonadota bacterium]|nr:hypothetical protein [Pseudomonadota bacterium]